MGREATLYLLERGVRVTGIDAWTWDVPFSYTRTGTGPADTDGDGVPDAADNCPNNANADHADNDGDHTGNVCDSTPDGEGGAVTHRIPTGEQAVACMLGGADRRTVRRPLSPVARMRGGRSRFARKASARPPSLSRSSCGRKAMTSPRTTPCGWP